LSPLSFTLLKTWSALTRGLLLVAVLVWLLLGATWGTLHWWIVPRIGEFRPQLEAQASKALGVPVRLSRITAHSGGLMPSFELTGVEVLDAQGRVALSLPRVLVTLSPRSVFGSVPRSGSAAPPRKARTASRSTWWRRTMPGSPM